jgi:hypothetical protein
MVHAAESHIWGADDELNLPLHLHDSIGKLNKKRKKPIPRLKRNDFRSGVLKAPRAQRHQVGS